MYGLVNRAVEDLVITRFGEAKWEEVLETAQVDVDGFVSMRQYDDQVTYRLVDAASKVLNLHPSEVLEAFGEYWTLFTAAKGYGPLLDVAGPTFHDFLFNLDDLHQRVAKTFRGMTPPHFVARDISEGVVELEYHSKREGLGPMVVGLLRGLAKRFSCEIELEFVVREDGATVFTIEYRAMEAAA